MELKVNEVQLPDAITFNYEELKRELSEKVSMYEALVYTDDQIREAKADKANLNKLKKALNDERIRREREYMQPFNDFKSKVNEIIGIIDKPIEIIDKQVKVYEEKQKQNKLDDIIEYFNNTEHPEWLLIAQIMNDKWLNVSVSIKTVQADIDNRLSEIHTHLETLANLPEFGFEATEVYKTSLDINKALNEGHRMAEIARAKAEAEAKKAEYEATQAAKLAEQMAEQKTADAMNPSAEPEINERPKNWVKFAALMTVDQALELKRFFDTRAIEFKAI